MNTEAIAHQLRAANLRGDKAVAVNDGDYDDFLIAAAQLGVFTSNGVSHKVDGLEVFSDEFVPPGHVVFISHISSLFE